jgi:hypothetical protein
VARHYWIVSDPPHREVDLDEAAVHLGLAVPEARMKVNFWAPELWLAYADMEEAAAVVQALDGAGLNALIVDARELPSVPPPTLAVTFRFEEDRLVAGTEDGEVDVPYDARVVGAFCRPPADFKSGAPARASRSSGFSMAGRGFNPGGVRLTTSPGQSTAQEVLERTATLDLYFPGDDGVRRVAIAQDVVDFSGFGEGIQGGVARKMDACIEECERRFTDLVLDKRQVNVRPRRRVTVGAPDPAAENRRLLAFGTMELQELLDSVSDEIGRITQYELSSRITYLTMRHEGPARDEEPSGDGGDEASD